MHLEYKDWRTVCKQVCSVEERHGETVIQQPDIDGPPGRPDPTISGEAQS
jgi:hypothetical protein